MVEPLDPKRGLQGYAKFATLGLQFGLTILVFVGLGIALDRWLSIAPAGLLGGLFLGAFGAFTSLYRAIYPKKDNGKDSK